jgi:PIN domain nuclease of toxin-antitoxin system
VVRLEIEILFERGRITNGSDTVLKAVADTMELTVSDKLLGDIVGQSLRFAWAHDPFDRLIVANAIADGVRLLTADQLILANFKDAVW